jgi:hypothetical protein
MRDPQAMGEVLIQSLARLRGELVEVTACEAADRLETLHRERRVVLPNYRSNEGPLERYGDPRA